jgi:hypothetical protein
LAAFFDLMNPASTIPKPACIKNTRNAAMSTHRVLSPSYTGAESTATSWARTGVAMKTPARPNTNPKTI